MPTPVVGRVSWGQRGQQRDRLCLHRGGPFGMQPLLSVFLSLSSLVQQRITRKGHRAFAAAAAAAGGAAFKLLCCIKTPLTDTLLPADPDTPYVATPPRVTNVHERAAPANRKWPRRLSAPSGASGNTRLSYLHTTVPISLYVMQSSYTAVVVLKDGTKAKENFRLTSTTEAAGLKHYDPHGPKMWF